MELLAKLCAADSSMLLATPYRLVDVNDPASLEAATEWWWELTATGNEGMVVKPLDFISRGRRGIAQPAVKCRGPEYPRNAVSAAYNHALYLEPRARMMQEWADFLERTQRHGKVLPFCGTAA